MREGWQIRRLWHWRGKGTGDGSGDRQRCRGGDYNAAWEGQRHLGWSWDVQVERAHSSLFFRTSSPRYVKEPLHSGCCSTRGGMGWLHLIIRSWTKHTLKLSHLLLGLFRNQDKLKRWLISCKRWVPNLYLSFPFFCCVHFQSLLNIGNNMHLSYRPRTTRPGRRAQRDADHLVAVMIYFHICPYVLRAHCHRDSSMTI